ncbi:ABC transporter ATP-binding protein [Sulfitobacter aestuarii]|uniref:ABC transporter ATP-binding protein n=1 Tax=Sulfitobacter aestuarii TaxID=2161676 RepID=A0ABW5U976_9RHOB
MSLSHLYKDLGVTETPNGENGIMDTALEDAKLQSFEDGYQAGWEDASKAHELEQTHVSAELAQSLQDLSFTYHEALGKLTLATQPLLQLILSKLLPPVLPTTLSAHILEQLNEMLCNQLEKSIHITVAPENLSALKSVFEAQVKQPFNLKADALLSAGQASLRVDTAERVIDLDKLIEDLATAVEAFYFHCKEEDAHG